MEHLIITDIGDGYVYVVAEKGYLLKSIDTGMIYSEAITDKPEKFVAVEKVEE